jgi:Putative mono-oxygenase ydhR
MKNAKSVLSVKFNSTLSAEKLISACKEDLEIFRNVPGLLQKYYITEESTGAISGIYIFETKSAREAFWNSALAKNIPTRYGVIPATLRVEQYEMAIVLNNVVVA